MRLCRAEPLVIQNVSEVHGVAFSPDGEQLASGGGDGKIKIQNSKTGAAVSTFLAHERAASSASHSTPTESTWPPAART